MRLAWIPFISSAWTVSFGRRRCSCSGGYCPVQRIDKHVPTRIWSSSVEVSSKDDLTGLLPALLNVHRTCGRRQKRMLPGLLSCLF